MSGNEGGISGPPRDILLRAYRPQSRLEVAEHRVERARFPAVDAHNHLGRWLSDDGGWVVPDVEAMIGLLDGLNVDAVVNLDGRWGGELEANLDRYDRSFPGRFATFATSTGGRRSVLDLPIGSSAASRIPPRRAPEASRYGRISACGCGTTADL